MAGGGGLDPGRDLSAAYAKLFHTSARRNVRETAVVGDMLCYITSALECSGAYYSLVYIIAVHAPTNVNEAIYTSLIIKASM